jgi:hypothetical protein
MLTPPQFDEVWTSVEPILTFGVDLALRASQRVAIAPGFRANFTSTPRSSTDEEETCDALGRDDATDVGAGRLHSADPTPPRAARQSLVLRVMADWATAQPRLGRHLSIWVEPDAQQVKSFTDEVW